MVKSWEVDVKGPRPKPAPEEKKFEGAVGFRTWRDLDLESERSSGSILDS